MLTLILACNTPEVEVKPDQQPIKENMQKTNETLEFSA